jgi:hypothetical protein
VAWPIFELGGLSNLTLGNDKDVEDGSHCLVRISPDRLLLPSLSDIFLHCCTTRHALIEGVDV